MPANSPYFDKIRRLESLLTRGAGHSAALFEINELVVDDDVRREFFLKLLKTPDWVAPLRRAGYFENPPAALQTEKVGLQHPVWPQSKYLARMAQDSPQ